MAAGRLRRIIYWYRQDLRVADLPGLRAALTDAEEVIPCYILDEQSAGDMGYGGASRWWLHHSLASLAADLANLGLTLHILQGSTADILLQLLREHRADAVYCSRCFEPWACALEQDLHRDLAVSGHTLKRFPGATLLQPEQVNSRQGTPFRVFTPFWRHCLTLITGATPLQRPRARDAQPGGRVTSELEALQLLPRQPNWARGWDSLWQPGEAGARRALRRFFAGPVADYAAGRDFPARQLTSRLSPHLHFGEISPRQVWHRAQLYRQQYPGHDSQADKFLAELGWREFSYHLLHHFPHIPERPFREEFAEFPWAGDATLLRAWQRGRTGYPLVDAGMRELWETGYMHNRVRMVAASFLCKHLMLPWQCGERWFRDTLVDADLANNACSWQWAAGCGADAAPYFRIFNPTLQSRKFDPRGEYLRRWLPELAALPDKHLHEPSEAPPELLAQAAVVPGRTYPLPVVEHRAARQAALAAWDWFRSG